MLRKTWKFKYLQFISKILCSICIETSCELNKKCHSALQSGRFVIILLVPKSTKGKDESETYFSVLVKTCPGRKCPDLFHAKCIFIKQWEP